MIEAKETKWKLKKNLISFKVKSGQKQKNKRKFQEIYGIIIIMFFFFFLKKSFTIFVLA